MSGERAVRRALLALAIAAALVSVLLAGTCARADSPASPANSSNSGTGSFISWLFSPIKGSMFVFLCIFAAGVLAGGGFVFLEYHDFKVSFESVGRILPYALPLAAIAAVGSTLAIHKHNFFLLSLYIAVPMFIAPFIYLAYGRFSGRGKEKKGL